MHNTSSYQHSISATPTQAMRSILASIVGNIIEWYDFALFACLAPVIAQLFFPKQNYVTGLLDAFAVFAMGFISRPLGSIIFGHFGDRRGRAHTLKITIFLISLPAIGVAILPTYQQIGVYAPILLIILRLLQGLCIGGEFAGAMIYLTEISPANKRALYSSMANNGSNLGVLMATSLVATLTLYLSTASFNYYGWRIPFLLGGCIGLLGLFLRRDIQETAIFLTLKQTRQEKFLPLKTVIQSNKTALLKTFMLLAISACGSYTLMDYLSSYLYSFANFTLTHALHLQMLFIVVTFIFVPLFAWLADYYGRWNILLLAIIGYLIFCIPCMELINAHHSWLVLLPLIIFYSAEQAVTPVMIVENFPAQARYTGISLAYNVTMASIGATAPFVCTWLIHRFHNPMLITAHIITCALISLVALVFAYPKRFGSAINLH